MNSLISATNINVIKSGKAILKDVLNDSQRESFSVKRR